MRTAFRSHVNPFLNNVVPAVRPARLYVEEYGSPGTNIVFVPGLGGTTRYWRGHLGSLGQAHHIILVDLLGFGESPKPWTRYMVDNHIQALHCTLEKYAPFTLVGHSMGTLLALAYAARHPEEVQALGLISLPFYGSRENAMRTVRQSSAFNRVFFGNMVLAAFSCVITRRVFGWLAPYLPTGLPREVAADIVKHSWRSFTSSLWEVIYKYDPRPDVDKLNDRLPVLCLHGERDRIAPPEGIRNLAAGRPNWRAQVLPGVDHHPLFRAPAETQGAIANLLAGVDKTKNQSDKPFKLVFSTRPDGLKTRPYRMFG